MREALQRHLDTLLEQELARAKGLTPQERRRVARACNTITASVVDGVLDEARAEPRLEAALASIYRAEPLARTTLSAWPAEAARRV
jgi:hypothetical protein